MSIPKLKLLSSTDSANLVGVSIDTINQYKDLGLLRVQQLDGKDYFEEDDIKLIFNSRKKDYKAPPKPSVKVQEDPELPTLSSILKEQQQSNSDEKDAKDSKVVRLHAERPEVMPIVEVENKLEETPKDETREPLKETRVENSSSSNSYIEFEGPSSIEILELSRSLKQQLELVLSERDWLRQRVEKLELQLERQQMISMSETETLRMLAKGREPNPSPWAFLLSWAQPKNK